MLLDLVNFDLVYGWYGFLEYYFVGGVLCVLFFDIMVFVLEYLQMVGGLNS